MLHSGKDLSPHCVPVLRVSGFSSFLPQSNADWDEVDWRRVTNSVNLSVDGCLGLLYVLLVIFWQPLSSNVSWDGWSPPHGPKGIRDIDLGWMEVQISSRWNHSDLTGTLCRVRFYCCGKVFTVEDETPSLILTVTWFSTIYSAANSGKFALGALRMGKMQLTGVSNT